MTTPDLAGLCERLRAKDGMTVCPYDRRSPDYWTTNDTDPCKFCGTKNEEGAPDLCKGVDLRMMDEAAAAIERLVAAGWRTDAENAPKDGRWIVVIDKFRNCDAIRWSNETSRFDPDQRERGWVSKFGGANTAPEHCVAWSEMPALEGASDDR